MVDTDKLVFKYKGKTLDENFSKFDNVLVLIDKTRNGEISLNDAIDEQTRLKSDIKTVRNGEISLNDAIDEQTRLKSDIKTVRKVQQRHLSKGNKEARTNMENLYNARKAAVNFLSEYALRVYEARYQAKKM